MMYQPYQQRVIDEKHQLDERLEKLKALFNNPVFHSLSIHEQGLMKQQAKHMTRYSLVLQERISGFPIGESK